MPRRTASPTPPPLPSAPSDAGRSHLARCLRAILPAVAALALALSCARAAVADETDAYFRKGEIAAIEIELEDASVEALRAEPRSYARCRVAVDGKPLAESAGVKLKGAAGSFQAFDDRPAFTVHLGKFDGSARFHGMRKFHLNNSVQDGSYLSEWTAASILQEAGVPCTRVSHARVRVNDRDLGLYVLKEAFDGDFLRRHFKNASGNLYDGGFCQDIDAELERDEGEGEATREDLRALSDACRIPDMTARWKRLEELVDIAAFVRFMALEAMLGHWDGYSSNSNNYRLYFEPGKRARFLLHGMDQCFQDPGMPVLDMPRALLASSVMKNPEWRSDYRRQIARLLPEFDPRGLARRIEPVQARIQRAMRDWSPEAAGAQEAAAHEFAERLVARAASLAEQRALPEPRPLVFKPGVPVTLRGLHGMSEVEDAAVEEVEDGGARWLRVTAGPSGRCVAGFRRGLLLDKGRYRLEALVRTLGVAALSEDDAPCSGAGIRISGSSCSSPMAGVGERTVEFEFDVTEPTADIEVVLELRAASGTAAFRVDSIRLTKLRPGKRGNGAPPAEGG